MPELPEIETIKRGLSSRLIGAKLRKVRILEPKSTKNEISKVCGRKVVGLRRFGKALIMDFEENESLMFHMRMTGQLIFDPNGENLGIAERFAAGHPNENFVDTLPNKQTRIVFYFDQGKLYFNDQRKFGFVKELEADKVLQDDFIAKLGKEPWEMSEEELFLKMQKHKNITVKAFLLDQENMAGLGNIYADETLFAAKIHPERKAGGITKEEAKRILECARKVMETAIEAGGSTLKNYLKADGTRGDYLDLFAKAYNREGKKCERCGTEIRKIRVAGRGTYFCPKCQRNF